jgi:hypothetical protein
MTSIPDSIYQGAVGFEQGKSLVSAILITVIAVGLAITGIYFISKKTLTVEATVKTSTCTTTPAVPPNIPASIICTTTVTFTINKINYTASAISSMSYTIGSKINVTYDPANPQSISLPDSISNTMTGAGSLVCALLLVIFAWTWWYLTNKYEAFAAVQAVGDVYSMFEK